MKLAPPTTPLITNIDKDKSSAFYIERRNEDGRERNERFL
jgi:hypothetical protein